MADFNFPDNIAILKDHMVIGGKTNVKFVLGSFDPSGSFVNYITKSKFENIISKLKKLPHETTEERMIQDDTVYLFLGPDDKVSMEKEKILYSIPVPLPGYKYGFGAIISDKLERKKSRRKFKNEKSFLMKRDIFTYKMWSFELLTITQNNGTETHIFELVFNNTKITDPKLTPDYYIKSAFMKIMDFNETF